MEEYKQLKDTLKKIPSFQDVEKEEGGKEQQPEARGPSPQSRPPQPPAAGAEQQQQVRERTAGSFRQPSSASEPAQRAECPSGESVWLCTPVTAEEGMRSGLTVER